MGGPAGPDLFGELVQLYLGDLPDQIRTIRTTIEQSDSASLRREAHRLKGSSQQMGAARLAGFCMQLENLGKEDRVADAMPFFIGAERECARVRRELALLKEKATL